MDSAPRLRTLSRPEVMHRAQPSQCHGLWSHRLVAGEQEWVLGTQPLSQGQGVSVSSCSTLSHTGVTLNELPGLSVKCDTNPGRGGALEEELVRETARAWHTAPVASMVSQNMSCHLLFCLMENSRC